MRLSGDDDGLLSEHVFISTQGGPAGVIRGYVG